MRRRTKLRDLNSKQVSKIAIEGMKRAERVHEEDTGCLSPNL